MIEVEMSVACEACDLKTRLSLTVDKPVAENELRAAVVRALGPDGAYICPRCGALVFVYIGETPVANPARLERAQRARRIGHSTKGLRFAVGDAKGARGAVWRVWMNDRRDDVYIAARSMASTLKVSLHPEFWYFGFTEAHVRRGSSLVPSGSDRKVRVWERPGEFAPGWTRAFAIVVPTSEVTEAPRPYRGSEAVWFPRPADGEAVHFTVLLSNPSAARGRRGYPNAAGFEHSTEFLTRLDMVTGEQLWVVAHVAPMTDGDTVMLGRARKAADQHGRHELTHRMSENPNFAPRALVCVESSEGGPYFYDVSLDNISRAGV